MQAEIDGLIARLTEFREQVATYKDILTNKAKVEGELKELQASVATAKAELKDAQSGLSIAQKQNKLDFDRTFQEKSKELEGILAQTTAARTELATLQAEVNSAMALHKQIEASIGSLRARLG